VIDGRRDVPSLLQAAPRLHPRPPVE